jgi:hypothetical protein
VPQTVYLDSHCLAYALGQPVPNGWTSGGIRRLQDSILASLRDDRIVICGSEFHIEEAARISQLDARRRFYTFFWEIVKWYVLLPTYDLVRKEAELCRPLEASEPFHEFWRRQTLRKATKDDAIVDDVAKAVADSVKKQADDGATRRENASNKLKALYSGKSSAEVSKAWWADAEAHVEDWMNDYIENSKEHLGISGDRSTWPKPRDLQTAWAIHAYHMARIVMNVGLHRKIGEGDVHDAHHFASAWYTDIFVTDDRAFRDTIKIIPNTPVTTLSFDEFALQLGVTPT